MKVAVLKRCFINNVLREPGQEFDYHGPYSESLRPLETPPETWKPAARQGKVSLDALRTENAKLKAEVEALQAQLESLLQGGEVVVTTQKPKVKTVIVPKPVKKPAMKGKPRK